MNELEEKILEILGTETKTQHEVVQELKDKHGIEISTRGLRKAYERIRNRFAEKEINFTVLFCSRGNYVSYDFATIKRDNDACRKTALAILKNAYARDKRIRNDDQLTFAEYLEMLEGGAHGDH